MPDRKNIQILRGGPNYNPSTSEEVLLDGQPFYSKYTKDLYIGDGATELKNLNPIYSNAALGQVYARCDSEADDTEKVINVNIPFKPSKGGILSVLFSKGVNFPNGANIILKITNSENKTYNIRWFSGGRWAVVYPSKIITFITYEEYSSYYVKAISIDSSVGREYSIGGGEIFNLSNGGGNKAPGKASHAQGHETTAIGDYSHAQGYYTTAFGDYSHAQGYYTTAIGDYSFSGGRGDSSFISSNKIFGIDQIGQEEATLNYHISNFSVKKDSLAYIMGIRDTDLNTLKNKYIKIYGYGNNPYKIVDVNIDENYITLDRLISSNPFTSVYQAYLITFGAVGSNSFAMGNECFALGNNSIAIGSNVWGSIAIGYSSCAFQGGMAVGTLSLSFGEASYSQGPSSISVGNKVTAIGEYSCAHGDGKNFTVNLTGEANSNIYSFTTSSYYLTVGMYIGTWGQKLIQKVTSIDWDNLTLTLEGTLSDIAVENKEFRVYANVALGRHSIAEGEGNLALNSHSYARGEYNIANGAHQTVIGILNEPNTSDAFIIGKGYTRYQDLPIRQNIFRVNSNNVYGGTYNSNGADYAEMWEWQDGNPNNEDRRGYFVTVDRDNKISFATSEDEYVLGIISSVPIVLGDSQGNNWHGKYLKDVFGEVLTEEVEIEEVVDEEGKVITPASTEIRPILNPEYKNGEEYISRDKRKEWSAVGLMGKLIVIDDGTCIAGSYCKVSSIAGIATATTNVKEGWRVLKRIDPTHIQIMFK